MKKILFIFCLLLLSKTIIFAQNYSVKIKLEDVISHEPLVGATVRLKSNNKIGASADINGIAELRNVPLGKQIFEATFVGYGEKEFTVEMPLAEDKQPFVVLVLPGSGTTT